MPADSRARLRAAIAPARHGTRRATLPRRGRSRRACAPAWRRRAATRCGRARRSFRRPDSACARAALPLVLGERGGLRTHALLLLAQFRRELLAEILELEEGTDLDLR